MKADGTSKVEEQRAYMREWIKADATQAQDLMTQYSSKIGQLASEGALPQGLADEISEKKKEIESDLNGSDPVKGETDPQESSAWLNDAQKEADALGMSDSDETTDIEEAASSPPESSGDEGENNQGGIDLL
jgi:hypothetical protein